MASVDDIATETEALFFQVAMQNKLPILPFIGECWNCTTPLNTGVFCDVSCSEDFEKVQRANRMNP